jgi:hypothetical protein
MTRFDQLQFALRLRGVARELELVAKFIEIDEGDVENIGELGLSINTIDAQGVVFDDMIANKEIAR